MLNCALFAFRPACRHAGAFLRNLFRILPSFFNLQSVMVKDRIDERFLRYVWSRPELRSVSLLTSSGEPIRIIDSGTLNTDGGPDVRGARIKIGNVLFAGDVE